MSQILVLGSGLGGLSCGVQLARMGIKSPFWSNLLKLAVVTELFIATDIGGNGHALRGKL